MLFIKLHLTSIHTEHNTGRTQRKQTAEKKKRSEDVSRERGRRGKGRRPDSDEIRDTIMDHVHNHSVVCRQNSNEERVYSDELEDAVSRATCGAKEGCWTRSDLTFGLLCLVTVCSRRIFSCVSISVFSSLSFLQAELQTSCSQHGINRGAEGCQVLCHCRTYPPVPPPPPPPPPPRGLIAMAPSAPAVLLRPWWMEIIVVGTTGSALAVFLLLTVIICYKAIKRYVMLSRS
ncbi:Proline-rich membrane anchor 1 [Labeo rohita]|uniref:Proline-rich membrane anchor 1 n=1 Tax=Labeo rohita TaxID=84645 RepID=A0ABQ8LVY1_LABRO|nr:Proline-rich membrane anchor 1 [Labeo rohita]